MKEVTGAFLVLTLSAVSLAAQSPDYSEPGDYGWSYREEDIPGVYETMESSRIYYPETGGGIPPSAIPCPIVVLGHGFNMGIDRYYSYAEHLASWGYLVVLPTFSNPFPSPEHYTRARCMVDAALFTAGLNTVPGDPFEGAVNETAWGFTGHSMGGGCAFLAADTFDLADTLRVAVSFHSPQTTPEVEAQNLDLPKLVLSGSVDTIAPWDEVRQAMWADAPAPGAFAVTLGANHGYCMDYSYFWENGGTATISREQQQSIIRLYLTAYMERYLHDDTSSWNFLYCYGDSILQNTDLDSVEVRLPTALDPSAASDLIHSGTLLSVNPNPSSGLSTIALNLEPEKPVSLIVFDLSGRPVRTLLDDQLPPQSMNVNWDGCNDSGNRLPEGVYVAVLRTSSRRDAMRLVRCF